MNLTSNNIQQYVRIILYWVFGALGSYGVTVGADKRAMIISVAGSLATLAWTAYGTRLNGLLEQVKEKTGVQEVNIKVDPAIITPVDVTNNTSPGIVAKAV